MRLYLSSFRLGNKPDEMLNLLSGKKHAAIIANATDYKTKKDRELSVNREVEDLKSLGLVPEELDLRTYFGRLKQLEQVLSSFDLLWVRGGNSFILRRAFKQSGADEIIKKMLMEDQIAYGGYSAGPVMLTPSLKGSEMVDDPKIVPEGYDPQIIWEGLGVLSYAFAPHFESPGHPETEAVGRYVDYLTMKGEAFKALHDGQAIVINESTEKVVG